MFLICVHSQQLSGLALAHCTTSQSAQLDLRSSDSSHRKCNNSAGGRLLCEKPIIPDVLIDLELKFEDLEKKSEIAHKSS